MSRGDRSDKIPNAILAGITDAFKTYERWTLNDRWLNEAPELFVSVEIARRLKKSFPSGHIDMETSVRGALSNAGAKTRGRPRTSERRGGRFDILLSRKNMKPWCAVEIKSPIWSVNCLESDIKRVCGVIRHRNNGSSLSCGAVAFYSDYPKPARKHASAKKALQSLGERAEALAKELVGKDDRLTARLFTSPFHKGNDDDGWQAFCLFFQMRKIQVSA